MTRQVVGGIETYLRALIPLLRDSGHEVTLAYEREAIDGAPSILEKDAGTFQIEARRTYRLGPRPDVVLMNGFLTPSLEHEVIGWAPTAYFAHTFLGICVSGTKRWARPSVKVCQRHFGVGCLVHYLPHGCGGWNLETALRLYSNQRSRLLNMRESRAILVASNYMAAEYLRNGFSNVHVLPLCVESGPAPTRKELPPEVMLLFVGRVTDLKGLDLLVRGARRFTNLTGRRCRVVVAGTGPALARAEKLASRLRVPLESLGWVDEQGRDELFQQATLLVIPSTWPEPFGLVGLEAARFGLPTVAFPVGGLGEWLRSGINGEFAEHPASSDSLADALVRATADPTHYGALVEGAWHEVERFAPPAHLRRLFDVFESLLETAPSLDSASEVQERSEPRAGQGEPQR